MKCPNCKAELDENSKFCDYCGKKIEENIDKPIIKKDKITEEEYQKYFIGNNYYNFKNKFNIFAFLLGGIYIFYRKQYIFGTIFILLTIGTMIFNPYIAIILHILLGISFNQQYVINASRKAHQIKMKNINKSKEEILKICNEKGNTSFLSAVFSIVIILLLIILILNIGGTDLKGEKGRTIIKVSDKKIESLLFEVPEGFKSGNYNTDSYRSYTYNKNNNYCRIKIETRKDNGEYTSVDSFLTNTISNDNKDLTTSAENITINKQLWKRINVKNSKKVVTYYATKSKDLYYIVSYDLYNNNSFCNEQYNTFMNSLNFRD